MDEQTRKERTLEALDLLAEEVEKLRMLREREMGVRIEYEEGALYVRPAEEG